MRSKQVGPADPSLSGLSADDRSTILGHSAPDPRVLKNRSKHHCSKFRFLECSIKSKAVFLLCLLENSGVLAGSSASHLVCREVDFRFGPRL